MTKFYLSIYLSLLLTLSSHLIYAQDNAYSEYLLDRLNKDRVDHSSNGRTHQHSPKCGTPLYLEAFRNWSRLNAEAQKAFSLSSGRHSYDNPSVYESQYFTIHYTTSGNDAVDVTDQNSNNIPDYIEKVADISDKVFKIDIQDRGFNPPPSDSKLGGSDKPDIYIYHLEPGLYGMVVPEKNLGNNPSTTINEVASYTTHMHLRSNYDGFPGSLDENLKVTLAHELSHMIDLAYNYNLPSWFLEAKGAWEEKRIYPNITDNFQYLTSFSDPDYAFDYGQYPLDNNTNEGDRWYSGWLLFQLVYEKLEDKNHPFFRKMLERGVSYTSEEKGYSFIDKELESIFDMSFDDIHRIFRISNGLLTNNKKIIENYVFNDAPHYRQYLRGQFNNDGQKYFFLYKDLGPISVESEFNFDGSTSESATYNSTNNGNGRLNRLAADYLSFKTKNLNNAYLELVSQEVDDVNLDVILYNSSTDKAVVKSGTSNKKIHIESPDNYDYKILVVTRNDSKFAGNTDASYEIKVTKKDAVTSLVDELNEVSISPNPTNGLINISYKANKVKNIFVHDITGKLKGTFKAETFNTEVILDGEKGMYFITLDNGKTFKVIKN